MPKKAGMNKSNSKSNDDKAYDPNKGGEEVHMEVQAEKVCTIFAAFSCMVHPNGTYL